MWVNNLSIGVKVNQQKRINQLHEELLLKGFLPSLSYTSGTWVYKDKKMALRVIYHEERNIITVTKWIAPFTKGKTTLLCIKDNVTSSINKVLDCVDAQLSANNAMKVFNKVYIYFGNYDVSCNYDINFVDLGKTDDDAVRYFIQAINSIDKSDITIGTSNVMILMLVNAWFKISKLSSDEYDYVKRSEDDTEFNDVISNVMIEELTSNLSYYGDDLIVHGVDEAIMAINDFSDRISFVS